MYTIPRKHATRPRKKKLVKKTSTRPRKRPRKKNLFKKHSLHQENVHEKKNSFKKTQTRTRKKELALENTLSTKKDLIRRNINQFYFQLSNLLSIILYFEWTKERVQIIMIDVRIELNQKKFNY